MGFHGLSGNLGSVWFTVNLSCRYRFYYNFYTNTSPKPGFGVSSVAFVNFAFKSCVNQGCPIAAPGLGLSIPVPSSFTAIPPSVWLGTSGVRGHLGASREAGAGWQEKLQHLLTSYQGISLAAVSHLPHLAAKLLNSDFSKPTQPGSCHPVLQHLLHYCSLQRV